MGGRGVPIIIPLKAVHVASERHGVVSERLAVLEPDAQESMSWIEVPEADFLEQALPLLNGWIDPLASAEIDLQELADQIDTTSARALAVAVYPGGYWELALRGEEGSGPASCVRLERRGQRRAEPQVERRLTLERQDDSRVNVIDVSEDGSGMAIDCDADELRALLMGGALREPGAHPIEIHVVRVQALGQGRFRVGCVVGRGQERARALLS